MRRLHWQRFLRDCDGGGWPARRKYNQAGLRRVNKNARGFECGFAENFANVNEA
jgi:hypothetical protein